MTTMQQITAEAPVLSGKYRIILQEVSERHGIDPEDVMSGQRSQRVVECRHEFWLRLNDHISQAKIARLLDLSESTISHGVRCARKRKIANYTPTKPRDDFPRPSYRGEATAMIAMARNENRAMLRNMGRA